MTPEKADYLSEDLMASMLAKIPGTRLGRPEDIAGVAALPLSEDGRWINGQVFNVNGGASLTPYGAAKPGISHMTRSLAVASIRR